MQRDQVPSSSGVRTQNGDQTGAPTLSGSGGVGETVAPGWLTPNTTSRPRAVPDRSSLESRRGAEAALASEASRAAVASGSVTELPGTPPRILIVDDEPTLRDTLSFYLRREGFEVRAVEDGAAALAAARADHPDLIVLDIMLPRMDGFQVCRTIRAESTVPILLLSARGEEFDRVLGLELGADDYLSKPFAFRELVARIRAMLRRAQMPGRSLGSAEPEPAAARSDQPAQGDRPVRVGDIMIDPLRRQATRGDAPLVLKPKEFDLLLHFARRPGIVHSRETLLRDVWGYDYPIDTRTVDVHIRWLRQKIEQDDAAPQRIETVRGHGYRFVYDE